MAGKAIDFQGVAFRGTKPPPKLEEIQSLEEYIGLTFPRDYFEFLEKVNGGKPKPAGYRYPRWEQDSTWPEVKKVDGAGMLPRPNKDQLALLQALAEVTANTKTPPSIARFLYLGRGSDSIKSMLVGQKFSDQPDASSLIPIALSDSNLPVYMSLSAAQPGAIFQFDEDFDFDPGPDITVLQDIQDLQIASSFSELLQNLFEPKPIFKPGFTPTEVHLTFLRGGYK